VNEDTEGRIMEQMTYLRLDQDQIDKQNHKIVFDVFIRKALASRALRETDSFTQ